ncbi:hypothetical protein [Methylocella tundrae]|uniref:hypothetical protein n=1 Tax=Methylocella tundrae TaxID=227605 RepID=UPI00106B63A4|nr:hypothetical protein [Methylocella tundrae]
MQISFVHAPPRAAVYLLERQPAPRILGRSRRRFREQNAKGRQNKAMFRFRESDDALRIYCNRVSRHCIGAELENSRPSTGGDPFEHVFAVEFNSKSRFGCFEDAA